MSELIEIELSPRDQAKLDALAGHYSAGDRSRLLALAIRKMEHDRVAERLRKTRLLVSQELSGRELSEREVVELCKNSSRNLGFEPPTSGS